MTKYLLIVLLLCSTMAWGEDIEDISKGLYLEDIQTPDIALRIDAFQFGEILRIEFNGNIFYKGRLITTDKDLIKAFYAVMSQYRCPKCGRLLDNYTTKDR